MKCWMKDCSKMEDKELITLLFDPLRREEGFNLTVQKYSKRLYWTIRRMVVSHDDADDVMQETFIKFWTTLDSFKGNSSIYTWLYRIAINSAINFLKARNRYQAVDVSSSEYFRKLTSDDSLYDGNEIEDALQAAIAKLPTKQQTVFMLRYYDEMSYADMSAVLGTSEGALKASYHIAAEKIEKEVKLSLIEIV